jgi:hypothetical protein
LGSKLMPEFLSVCQRRVPGKISSPITVALKGVLGIRSLRCGWPVPAPTRYTRSCSFRPPVRLPLASGQEYGGDLWQSELSRRKALTPCTQKIR